MYVSIYIFIYILYIYTYMFMKAMEKRVSNKFQNIFIKIIHMESMNDTYCIQTGRVHIYMIFLAIFKWSNLICVF